MVAIGLGLLIILLAVAMTAAIAMIVSSDVRRGAITSAVAVRATLPRNWRRALLAWAVVAVGAAVALLGLQMAGACATAGSDWGCVFAAAWGFYVILAGGAIAGIGLLLVIRDWWLRRR
jgi:hypothetical protein